MWLTTRKRFDGQVFWTYVALYAVARFIIEIFRGDLGRGSVLSGALSTSQLIALIMFGVAILAMFLLRKRPESNSPSVSPMSLVWPRQLQ